MMIAENLKNISEKISAACHRAGRNPEEVLLVAVSKTKPVSDILDAFNSGIKSFGENKAQELQKKSLELSEEYLWHFIGHLQTNKVKYVIDSAELIHSVDSIKLAKEISKRAERINKVQRVLLEVKTSEEDAKLGLSEFENIVELAEFCEEVKFLKLDGLMTMAPYTADDDVIRNCFKTLKNDFDKLNQKGFNLTELSMGMTNDFEIAIEEGATIIRVGTAIFGNRNYNKPEGIK